MADCAILAVASATETVRALLRRLIKNGLDEQASTVPWTIVNKYYTADVQFLVHSLSSWAVVQHELATPAVLFVWNRGESYRDQIHDLSRHASQHEVEVALAVRLSPAGATSPGEVEDDQDIDAYLSFKGFEFVDVPEVEASSFDRTSILGLPRIIDALSTIMWPSMVRQGFVGASHRNPGISSDDYHSLTRLVGDKISGNDGDRIQQELEELERWLDGEDVDAHSTVSEGEIAPWSTVVTPGTLSPSSSGFLENTCPTPPRAGFDDDFASFVSAPSTDPAGVYGTSSESLSSPLKAPSFASTDFSSTFSFDQTWSGRSTPVQDDPSRFDTALLVPGRLYKPLGSVSDFGDPEKESVNLELSSNSGDGNGEDMPSRAEIAEASRKIFGAIPRSLSPLGDGASGEGLDAGITGVDLEHFDLQSVLCALQGLREEIAGMPDKERRKAAARVALGLAYGLSSHSEASKELV